MKIQSLFDSTYNFNIIPGVSDICIMFFYGILLILGCKYYQGKKLLTNPEYKYFSYALFLKVLMVLAMCLVYTLRYDGGDTTAYYMAADRLGSFLQNQPSAFFRLIAGPMNTANFSRTGFDLYYNWPFIENDSNVWFVIKITSIFTLIGFKNYFTTSIVIAVCSFFGIWKLFTLLNKIIPGNTKNFAIAFLFIPSVAFWGSGILKDTYTFSALCWFIYCFYHLVMFRKKIFFSFIGVFLSLFIIISIKPYIFLAVLPSIMIWTILFYIKQVKSRFVRLFFFPSIAIIAIVVSLQLYSMLQQSMGEFSTMDEVLNKAVVTQQDLKADYYGGESFDIGKFEPTIPGILSKFPQALAAGLFRPYLWEARNPMMLVSAIENIFILLLFIFVLIRVSPFKIYTHLSENSYLIFALFFALFFCFSVGLTTSNFGSLVRYKIPGIPFFVSVLLILLSISKKRKGEGIGIKK